MASAPILSPPPRQMHQPAARQGDAGRRRALARYAILDTPPESEFTEITRLAAEICAAPFAAISFLDQDRLWFKAAFGLDFRETPIELSFCNVASTYDEVFVVHDALSDARFAKNLLVTGRPGIRFYAGKRVQSSEGIPVGALCVLDTKARPGGLTPAERLTLEVLASQVQSLLELRRSITVQRRQIESKEKLARRLSYVAEHDGLTGLTLREPFLAGLNDALKRARSDGSRAAVMLIDVDHFKQVNDSHGHATGDALLRSFGMRLRSVLRESDIIARLGGDEFGVVLGGINTVTALGQLVRSVEERLNQPFQHKGRTIECQGSIGVAIYPDHAATAAGLMKCSDLALASAKEDRGRVVTFHSELAEQFDRETTMLEVARAGLRDDRIVPFYQPKVDLATERVVGFEALVRCVRTTGDPLLPETFSHALEEREVARLIGERMLEQVLSDMAHWSTRGLDFGHVAINTCAADFQGNSFGERLLDGLRRRNLKPHQLQIEVTEGVFLGRGTEYVSRALELLSSQGIRVSLDDFGTGYASLTHLKQFPVDAIKIDRSFIDGIGKRADDATIVKALIGLGQSLGIETIAEGLESAEQVAFVKSHGCAIGQGFIFGRALPAGLVPQAILTGSARSAA